MNDFPIEVRVPLGDGIEVVLKVSESPLLLSADDGGGCAASCTIVAFTDVEKPPPRKRVSSMKLRLPVSGEHDQVDLLSFALDVDLDYRPPAS